MNRPVHGHTGRRWVVEIERPPCSEAPKNVSVRKSERGPKRRKEKNVKNVAECVKGLGDPFLTAGAPILSGGYWNRGEGSILSIQGGGWPRRARKVGYREFLWPLQIVVGCLGFPGLTTPALSSKSVDGGPSRKKGDLGPKVRLEDGPSGVEKAHDPEHGTLRGWSQIPSSQSGFQRCCFLIKGNSGPKLVMVRGLCRSGGGGE